MSVCLKECERRSNAGRDSILWVYDRAVYDPSDMGLGEGVSN